MSATDQAGEDFKLPLEFLGADYTPLEIASVRFDYRSYRIEASTNEGHTLVSVFPFGKERSIASFYGDIHGLLDAVKFVDRRLEKAAQVSVAHFNLHISKLEAAR
jgi:hypothetical protein